MTSVVSVPENNTNHSCVYYAVPDGDTSFADNLAHHLKQAFDGNVHVTNRTICIAPSGFPHIMFVCNEVLEDGDGNGDGDGATHCFDILLDFDMESQCAWLMCLKETDYRNCRLSIPVIVDNLKHFCGSLRGINYLVFEDRVCLTFPYPNTPIEYGRKIPWWRYRIFMYGCSYFNEAGMLPILNGSFVGSEPWFQTEYQFNHRIRHTPISSVYGSERAQEITRLLNDVVPEWATADINNAHILSQARLAAMLGPLVPDSDANLNTGVFCDTKLFELLFLLLGYSEYDTTIKKFMYTQNLTFALY